MGQRLRISSWRCLSIGLESASIQFDKLRRWSVGTDGRIAAHAAFRKHSRRAAAVSGTSAAVTTMVGPVSAASAAALTSASGSEGRASMASI